MSYIYGSLGTAFSGQDRTKEAFEYYKKSYDIRKDRAKPDELSNSLINLGKMADRMNDFQLSREYYERAIEISQEAGILESLRSANQGLAKLHERKGNYARALGHQKSVITLMDSLNKKNVSEQVVEMATRYETEKKEQEIALLNAQKEVSDLQLRNARMRTAGLSIGLVMAGILAILLYRQSQKIKDQNKLISKSLSEKDVLLREIHHRVKNNLQVVSSLLNLQSRHVDDKNAQIALKEGQNRVKSMALIHQNLYQEENLLGLNVKEYFEKLIRSLFHSYNINPDKIQLELSIADIELDVDTLIPIGLIINELISNALKHAFKGLDSGKITVKLDELEERLYVQVSDNGIGLSQNQKAALNSSFGYRLIQTFSSQLDAQLKIQSEEGTKIEMWIADYQKVA